MTAGSRRLGQRARHLLLGVCISGSALVGASPDAGATSTPIAALSFDENKGEKARDSAGEHDGTVDGAKWNASGKYGSALEFDGEEGLVTIPDANELDLTEEFTLEAWLKPTATHEWASLFFKEDSSSPFFSYLLYAQSPGEIPSAYTGLEGGVNGSGPLPLNTWSHITLTSDAEQSRLYIDGELDEVGAAVPLEPTDGPLQIGGNEIWGEHFDGLVDEVRIYDEALGSEEIEEDMETSIGLAPPPQPILALSFDENEGEKAHDSVGDHDGTINDAVWAPGQYGSALEFNGEEGIVTIPDSNKLDLGSEFTWEAWVRPNSIEEWATLLLKEDSGEPPFGYLIYAQNPNEVPSAYLLGEESSEGGVNGSEPLPLNTWTHLAVVSSGKQVRLYVNGELDEVGGTVDLKPTDGPLQIGGNEIWGEHLDGRLDEIRVYDEALGASEVEEDMETSIGLAPPPQPVAALSFDENKGEVARDSFGNHDGTVDGATWTASGKYGSALEFDGEDDLVKIPDTDDSLDFAGGSFTLEAWVRPQSEHEWGSVIMKPTEEFFGYALYATDENGNPGGATSNEDWTASAIVGPEPLPLNAWSHLALTSDGEDMRLYVNGELIETEAALEVQESDGDLQIGGNEVFGEYFDGVIDEIRLYDQVLGIDEVRTDEETPLQALFSKDPVAAYAFNDGEGNKLTDSVGNYDGTVHGANWVSGKYGGALKFDAESKERVSVSGFPNIELAEAFTLDVWVKPESSEKWNPILGRTGSESDSYTLYAGGESSTPQITVTTTSGSVSAIASSKLSSGVWSNIAVTSDGESLRLYVNGELADVAAASQPIASIGPLQLGADGNLTQYLKGVLDDLRVYPRALESGEIESLFEETGTYVYTKPDSAWEPSPFVVHTQTGFHQLSSPIAGYAPSIAPDERRIAYIAPAEDPEEGFSVYVTDIDGSNPQSIYTSQQSEWTPLLVDLAWSPDDESLLITSNPSGENHWDILRLNSTPTGKWNVETVINWPGNQDSVAVSPDGSRIAFTGASPSGYYAGALYVTNRYGGNYHKLVQGLPGICHEAESSWPGNPSFSPGGTQIAFDADYPCSSFKEVYIVNLANGKIRQLTSSGDGLDSGSYAPAWARNGSILHLNHLYPPLSSFKQVVRSIRPDGLGGITLAEAEAGAGPSEDATLRVSTPPPLLTSALGPEDKNQAMKALFRYAPTLRYDDDELFRAHRANSITDAYSGEESNSLKHEGGEVQAYSNPGMSEPPLSLDYLGGNKYPDNSEVSTSDFLSEYGSDEFTSLLEYGPFYADPEAESADRVYGRVIYDGGRWWLQYWFWYYYNRWLEKGAGNHEGDWEMVQFGLDETGEPEIATFAQHNDDEADSCPFEVVDLTIGAYGNISPQVYVAEGSHASYFYPGTFHSILDEADGDGYTARTIVVPVTGEEDWLQWPGVWGDSGKSPRSPVYQTLRWNSPSEFDEQAESCPVSARQGAFSARGLGESRSDNEAPSSARPPAPKISGVRREGGLLVRYSWSPKEQKRVGEVQVTVQARDPRVIPTGGVFTVKKPMDHVMLSLPSGSAPYTLRATAISKKGARSSEVTQVVR